MGFKEIQEVYLGDIAEEITVGFVGSMTSEYIDTGIPFLRSLNVEHYKVNLNSLKFVNQEFHQKLKKSALKPGDVVIVRTGKPGTCTVIPDWLEESNCSDLVIVRPGNNLDSNFLAAYINTIATSHIDAHIVGAVQQHFNVSSAKKVKLKLPSIETQRKIGKIAANLNDKIEVNEKIINLLEQISNELFKSWFIDFEFPNEEGLPYKASGGKMLDSELGEIPDGWQLGTLGSLGSIIGGGTPSKKEESYYTENGISWITPKDLSNNKSKFIYRGAIDITQLGLAKGSAKLLPEGSVLFSSRAPIGYIAFAGKEVTTNQGFKSVVCDKGYSNYFIYFVLHQMLPTIEANAGGSTFKEISGQGLKSIVIVLPPVNLVREYTKVVKAFFEQIKSTESENVKLINIRDSLLPKLLSGEIEIPDESVVV